MTQIEHTINLQAPGLTPKDVEILKNAITTRDEAGKYILEEKYLEAMERTVTALKIMRDFPDFQNPEFRILFVALLFDLAEIH